jgi:hypothetical protein
MQEKKRKELEAEMKRKQEEEAMAKAAEAARLAEQGINDLNAGSVLATDDAGAAKDAIQASGSLLNTSKSSDGFNENASASKIQDAWRRYCVSKVSPLNKYM